MSTNFKSGERKIDGSSKISNPFQNLRKFMWFNQRTRKSGLAMWMGYSIYGDKYKKDWFSMADKIYTYISLANVCGYGVNHVQVHKPQQINLYSWIVWHPFEWIKNITFVRQRSSLFNSIDYYSYNDKIFWDLLMWRHFVTFIKCCLSIICMYVCMYMNLCIM